MFARLFKSPPEKETISAKPKFDFHQLQNITVGDLEGENDILLKDSLIMTNSIQQFLSGKYNYVLSPKGMGKSAIFNAFEKKYFKDTDFDFENSHFSFINEAFEFNNEYLSEDRIQGGDDAKSFTFSWALYLISKLINDIKNQHCEKLGYLQLTANLRVIEDFKDRYELHNILDNLNQLKLSAEFVANGQQIEFNPRIERRGKKKSINLNFIFNCLNDFFKTNHIKAYIFIDRIDNFVEGKQYDLRKKYIHGLIKTVEEIRLLSNISPVLFLRTDLFNSLNISYEFDKIRARQIQLKWSKDEILAFITRRFWSNYYIEKNFAHVILDAYQKEFSNKPQVQVIQKKFLGFVYFRKEIPVQKKLDLTKNLNYRISETFLQYFFPLEISHKNWKFEEEEINFFEWLFSHFKDENDYINPRCLIRFFNVLFKEQFYAYQNEVAMTMQPHFLEERNDGNNKFINLFLSEVISSTYTTLQLEESYSVLSVLRNEQEQMVFKQIIKINYRKNSFSYGDIALRNYQMDKEEYDRLIKFLTILGVLKEIKHHTYSMPILHRHNKLD